MGKPQEPAAFCLDGMLLVQEVNCKRWAMSLRHDYHPYRMGKTMCWYGQNCPASFIRPHLGLWILPGIASSSLKTKASVDHSQNSISPNLLSYKSPQFSQHRKPMAVFWVCFLIRKHPRFCARQTGTNLGIGLHLAWAVHTTSPNNVPSNLLATQGLTCIALGCMHAPLQILEYTDLSFP